MKANLRVHVAPVGFEIERVTQPLIDWRADKVYLILGPYEDMGKGTIYLKAITEILDNHKNIEVKQLTSNIWDLYDLINKFKSVLKNESKEGSHIYVNVSTGSKIASVAGTLSCMIWKGVPYYAHIDYDYNVEYANGIKHDKVTSITEIPVYSINIPMQESLTILQILKDSNGEIKKKKLIEKLETEGYINSKLKIEAKHSKLRALLNQLSQGSDNPLVIVEYGGRQSKVKITTQGEATLKIFGET